MYQYDLLHMGDPRAVKERMRMFSSDLTGHISNDPLRNYKYLFVAPLLVEWMLKERIILAISTF